MSLSLIGRFLQIGASLTAVEVAVAYLLPLFFLSSKLFGDFCFWNGVSQLALFSIVVQVPAVLTGKMAYVDIGWPSGLCLLAINGFIYGTGWYWRRVFMCSCLLFHGGRMALGALVLFFPYNFPNGDLPRYQYAKRRWIEIEGLPESWWAAKMQQETLSQCFANTIILATPIMLAVFNPSDSIHPVEAFGYVWWGVAWLFENAADGQMLRFKMELKSKRRILRAKEKTKETEGELRALSQAIIGYPPFDHYSLWSMSRHPNYFGELMCWVGLTISALPSLAYLASSTLGDEGPVMVAMSTLSLLLVPRFFYDCLMYWTGAEPAESSSVKKRPAYREYQRNTPVLFPFSLPGIPSHQSPGWPGTVTHD